MRFPRPCAHARVCVCGRTGGRVDELIFGRAVIVGFTTECRESEGWIDRMGIDMLPHGRHQPFYFVSIDTRFHAAHGIPHYVAQDDIILERTTDVRDCNLCTVQV